KPSCCCGAWRCGSGSSRRRRSWPRYLAHHSEAVVRVAEPRWQRGAVRHRAPRILVAPGAAARDATRAGLGPLRIPLGRSRVVAVVVPVQAPLVADAGEGEEPQRVCRRLGGAGRPVEAGALRTVRAPWEARAPEPAARRLLPLRLGREPTGSAVAGRSPG